MPYFVRWQESITHSMVFDDAEYAALIGTTPEKLAAMGGDDLAVDSLADDLADYDAFEYVTREGIEVTRQ